MIELKVNGVQHSFDGEPDMPLLWYLRDVLALTGTKFGCGMALCGACTVHKNGKAVRSCITTMQRAAGSEIRTIEDIGHERPASGAEGLDGRSTSRNAATASPDRSCRRSSLLNDEAEAHRCRH